MLTLPTGVLAVAQSGVVALLAGVDGDRWSAPTPCDGWTVAQLARHLVAGERAFTIALGGASYDLAAIAAEVETIGEPGLAEAYSDAVTALQAAYDATPADRFVPTPIGEAPRGAVAGIRTLEAVVHGWDLARALDLAPADVDLGSDDDLAELVHVADRLRVALDAARPGNTALGTRIVLDADAPALDRVVARLGRQPAR